ncbi:MAG: AAA family ATPase, partial [Myxococcales bacterium]|nr:AAA family ATPase [Myxococcales bacterium]
AFLDEIFKANSAILNSLLSLVNERIFHHGRHRDRVPLIGLIGASNESPDPEGGLGALHDRFLVRLAVAPVDDEQGFLRVALGDVAPFTPDDADRLTLDDLAVVREAARAVTVPERVRAQLVAIRAELADAGVPASDRRFRHALDLLRVAAVTSGRAEVGPVELVLLQHCFGDPAETAMAVVPIIRRALEALVQPPSSHHVAAAWDAFDADADERAEAGLDRAIAGRLTDLDRFETALVHAVAALDAERDQVAAAVEASPWMAGLPPRLMAGFIGARRALARFARGLEAYRERLAGFDLFSEVVPQVRRAQFASVGHGRPYYDGRPVPLWIARPGARSDDWLPLSDEGVLLADQRAAIAGAVQRDLIDETMGRGQAVTEEVRWERAVRAVVLDNARLFALLSREGAAHDPALFPELADARGAAAALEALARWLRGAEVRRLPSPPPLDG